MRIDVSKLDARTVKKTVDVLSYHGAERKGREQAFSDLAVHGFAFAYKQAEVQDSMETSVLDDSGKRTCLYFHNGYRQAVLGYFMAHEVGVR